MTYMPEYDDELDSCPCCGKSAYLTVIPSKKQPGSYDGTVSCACCGLELHVTRSTKGLAAEEAAAGWNNRVYK